MLWAPTYFAVVQPVERTLDGRVGGDVDGLLSAGPVGDVLVEPDRHRLTDAHDLAVARSDVGHREVSGGTGGEAHLAARRPAQPERLHIQRVVPVVAELLGGGPMQSVGAELTANRAAVVIDHGDRPG